MTKRIFNLPLLMAIFLFGNQAMISCKNKEKEVVTTSPTTVDTMPAANTTAPVVIQEDDPLTKSVADATKDYPTVETSVKDGTITLTGEIERSNLKDLMKALNNLNPKKIDNQLKIK